MVFRTRVELWCWIENREVSEETERLSGGCSVMVGQSVRSFIPEDGLSSPSSGVEWSIQI